MFTYASKNTIQKKQTKSNSSLNHTGIPNRLKSNFESLSGLSLDDVNVHYNSSKPAQLHSLAFTQGNQVYLGAGQEMHLGHELGHVIQQKQGRVQPTFHVNGIGINNNALMESEASEMGEKANRISGNQNTSLQNTYHLAESVVQCFPPPDLTDLFPELKKPVLDIAAKSIDFIYEHERITTATAGLTGAPVYSGVLTSKAGEYLGGKVGSVAGRYLFTNAEKTENITALKVTETIMQLVGKGIGATLPATITLLQPGTLQKAFTSGDKFSLSGLWYDLLKNVQPQLLFNRSEMICYTLGSGLRMGLNWLWKALPGIGDAQKREDILTQYGIIVSADIKGQMLNDIRDTLSILSQTREFEHGIPTLMRIQPGNGDVTASFYDYNRNEISINSPFGMPYFLYTYLDKSSPWQRTLMDYGTFMGLPDKQKDDEDQPDTPFTARSDGGPQERHIMAGVSDVNSKERLVSWTLRHEIGHAMDKHVGWEDGGLWANAAFGSWEKYDNLEAAYRSYNGEESSDKMNRAIFERECKNYPFTFDDGGPVRADGRIYMMDEYGEWVSYSIKARNYAVSNYQFSASSEWFAEAFAAYYNPVSNAASRNRLHSDVRLYFCVFIGPFHGKKSNTADDSPT